MKVGIIEEFYYILLYIFYVMYLLVVLNLAYFKNVTTYLPLIQSALKYFVILFLMVRFNPYSHDNFSEFDKKIVFSSSLSSHLSSSLSESELEAAVAAAAASTPSATAGFAWAKVYWTEDHSLGFLNQTASFFPLNLSTLA